MRWMGLRIRDAIMLETSRLTKPDRGGDCILLYQAKTGEPVYCPIAPTIAKELRNVASYVAPLMFRKPPYFFWSGNGLPGSLNLLCFSLCRGHRTCWTARAATATSAVCALILPASAPRQPARLDGAERPKADAQTSGVSRLQRG